MYEEVRSAARAALLELLDAAALKPGQQVVIGCSSSEIVGQKIGKGSTPEAAKAVVDEILPILNERGLYLEAQCCEHLNRALIMERAAAEKFGYEIVCVRPRPKAGGSFATAVYEAMDDPVAVEFVKADAGLDIGNTMIGMHLKHVAVHSRAYSPAAVTRRRSTRRAPDRSSSAAAVRNIRTDHALSLT